MAGDGDDIVDIKFLLNYKVFFSSALKVNDTKGEWLEMVMTLVTLNSCLVFRLLK